MSSRHATVIAAVRCCERAGSGRHRKRSSILPLVVLLLLSVIIDRTAGSLETVGDFVEAPKPASLQGKSREQIKKEFDAFLKDIWMKKYFHQWKPFGTFSVETLDSSSPKVSALGYEKLKRTKEVDMSKCKTNQMKIPLIKEERSGDELERVCQGHAFVNKCEGVCFSSLRPSVSTFAGMHKECSCCREGVIESREVRLGECFDASGARLVGQSMMVTINEPKDCACIQCS